MDPATIAALGSALGGLKGGGGSKSQSSVQNSLAVSTTANIGVNPLFGIASGGNLDNLTAGSAGITGAGGATASGQSNPSQSQGAGTSFPYAGSSGYPAVNDIDQQPRAMDLFGGLIGDPVTLAMIAGGVWLFFEMTKKGKRS